MGSVATAVQEDSTSPSELEAAFLERCAASGDAAYGELRELLARLHDPATRQEARVFLTGLRRRSCSGEDELFRRYGFCVRELLLHDSRCGLPITTLSSGVGHGCYGEPTSGLRMTRQYRFPMERFLFVDGCTP